MKTEGEILRRLSLVEERVEKLEQVEQGLIPFSNEPTEVESWFAEKPKRKLHSFVTGEIVEDGGMPRIYCAVCHVDLSLCGATEDSWYCD